MTAAQRYSVEVPHLADQLVITRVVVVEARCPLTRLLLLLVLAGGTYQVARHTALFFLLLLIIGLRCCTLFFV